MHRLRVRSRSISASLHRSAGGEAGFTLIEVVLGTVIFLTVGSSVAQALTDGIAIHGFSRQKTSAQQLANQQIESIRKLPYDSVGTIGGNPPGVVDGNVSTTIGGAVAVTLKTRISYVDDAVPSTYATAANYKKVVVTVTRTSDLLLLSRVVTYVAPQSRTPLGGINNALINVQVLDSVLNTPIPDADVDLATGPSAPRSDVTDAAGNVTFAALTANPVSGPQAYYDLIPSKPGYQLLAADAPPSTAAHAQLAPGQTFTTALRMYLPAAINVVVTDAVGNPYAGPVTISVKSSTMAQSYSASGGSSSLSPVVPGMDYTVSAMTSTGLYAAAVTQSVPDNYPTVLSTTFTLRLLPFPTGKLNIHVRSSGTPTSGARVDVSGGPLSIFVTGTADSGGVLTIDVPIGPGYTVSAVDPSTGATGRTTNVFAPPNGTNVVDVDIS
jgi:Tfp pilus assembly protein PilV